MKQNQKIMWIHVFVVLLIIAFICGAFVGSYILIQNLFKTDSSIIEKNYNKQVIVTDVSLDDVAINLIYEVNNEKITQAVIEIFSSRVGNMDYVTIPGNMVLEVSDEFLKKIEKYNIEFNEDKIRLDELSEYFGAECFQFGQLLIGDILDIDISYYTAYERKNFVKYFVLEKNTFYYGKKKYEYDMQVFSETFKTRLRQFDLDLNSLITEGYEEILSNFNINNKMKYISRFATVNVDNIYNWHLIGESVNGRFVINNKYNRVLLTKIISRKKQYSMTQDKYNQIIDKKGN